ncbi:MAG: zinc ribbon domain-containing protein [Halobacteriales archaeon]
MSRRRAAIAAFLALFAPGLGHVYLRAWIRAIAWFLLATVTVSFVLPESAFAGIGSGGIGGMIETITSLPSRVYLTSLTVRVASGLDAGLIALRAPTADTTADATEAEASGGCPQCGKDLDDELDFCPWCTTHLESEK